MNTTLSVLGALFVFTFLYSLFMNSGHRDSTDSARERSGFILFTDHGTGVQYVGIPFIGMTVRVDKDGKPMIAEESK